MKIVRPGGGVEIQSVYFGKCEKISKECLICDFMPKNGLFLSPSLGDFIINKFQFLEYLRKN